MGYEKKMICLDCYDGTPASVVYATGDFTCPNDTTHKRFISVVITP